MMMMIKKEAEYKLKYENLNTEVPRMWRMKYFFIQVIIEATGSVTKGLKNSGNKTRKVFSRFSTGSSCTRDISHNKESATNRDSLRQIGGVLHWFKRRIPKEICDKR
jgi:hypothetical protein